MEWLKLDSRVCQDLAVARLNDREFRDFIRLLTLCAWHETDGKFDEKDAKLEGVSQRSISALATAGLVTPNGNGYHVTNWLKYQRTKAQIEAERAGARARRQKDGRTS